MASPLFLLIYIECALDNIVRRTLDYTSNQIGFFLWLTMSTRLSSSFPCQFGTAGSDGIPVWYLRICSWNSSDLFPASRSIFAHGCRIRIDSQQASIWLSREDRIRSHPNTSHTFMKWESGIFRNLSRLKSWNWIFSIDPCNRLKAFADPK